MKKIWIVIENIAAWILSMIFTAIIVLILLGVLGLLKYGMYYLFNGVWI